MTTLYPNQIDSFTVKVDNQSDVRSADINDVQDAVISIENQLGPNIAGKNQPSGWTLADRLNVFINENGTFKASVLTSSDIPSGCISDTKIFHNDTFQFKSIKVGQHDGSYGYTGNGPGVSAGVTIDENGNTFTDGNITTAGVINANNTVNINANTNLGNNDNNVVQVQGTINPQSTSKFDIGSQTKRFRTAYIDTLLGLSTGGETLTVATSALFSNTLIVKSYTDTSSGTETAFIGALNGDMVIQSPINYKIRMNPYNTTGHSVNITNDGDLQLQNVKLVSTVPIDSTQTVYSSGGFIYWQQSPMDVDCYNFYVKYPYVQSSIQEQLIAFNGRILSVSSSTSNAGSGTNFTINNNGSLVCTLTNVTSGAQKITNVSSANVVENTPLALNITSVNASAADLRVQVKVKRN